MTDFQIILTIGVFGAVIVLIALDLIPDFFKTPLNVTGHLAATALIAGSGASDTS